MSLLHGTHAEVDFVRHVDGDTIRVAVSVDGGDPIEESLRILSLDTEESFAGGGKPVTPLGLEAKQRAGEFFNGAEKVTIEFPGTEDLAICMQRYRGNYGRLLVYVYREGLDFQQTMIREGYSPYFNKYGNAEFDAHHKRFVEAERLAQRDKLGIWDQLTHNGSERRNYAALGTWWALRAAVIDSYRAAREDGSEILNTRLDYETIRARAENGESATVFTDLRSISRVGQHSGLINIGSIKQPFSFYIPNIESESGQEIVNLLENRYISSGDDHPRRSYAYVSGTLSSFAGKPQIVLTAASQILDFAPADTDSGDGDLDGVHTSGRLRISALLPNPEGTDRGNERVTLQNDGQIDVDLAGWYIKDLSGKRFDFEGTIDARAAREFVLSADSLTLNNSGDDISLFDPADNITHSVSYRRNQVKSGIPINFD